MKKVKKLIAKNKLLSMLVFCVLECFVFSYFLHLLKTPIGLITIIDLWLILGTYCYISSINNFILKESIKKMDEGDPTPLFQDTEELLTYKNSEAAKQFLFINKCVALREMGEFRQVYDILTSINIDKCSSMLPGAKFVYYNNLFDINDILGNAEQADIWYSKMMQIYEDLPNNKFKKSLQNSINSAKTAKLFREGDYEQVIDILNGLQSDKLRFNINAALQYAEVSLKLNDIQKAKEKLNYIISNGNKLYAVTIAKELMQSIK